MAPNTGEVLPPASKIEMTIRCPLSPKWLLVGLLSGGLTLDYFNRMALFSVIPLWRADLNASDATIGLVAAAFLWTYGLLSPFAGYLGDRFSRRSVVIVSMAAWSLITSASALVATGSELVGMRALLAVAQVPYLPVAEAMIADFHTEATRARASGYFQVGSYAGIILAGLPVAGLATHWGWRPMMLVSGLAGIVFVLVLVKYLPRPASVDGPKPSEGHVSLLEVGRLLRVPSVLTLMLAFSLVSISIWIVITYLPLFIYQQYHVGLETAAFDATFYVQVAAFLVMPLFTTFSDRQTARNPQNRYWVLALASILGLPALIAVGFSHHTAILAVGSVGFGLVMASSDSSWLPMLCNVVPSRQWGAGYGLLNFAGTIGGGLAALGVALLMHRFGLGAIIGSLGVLFIIIAGLVFVCGYVFLDRDRRKALQADAAASEVS